MMRIKSGLVVLGAMCALSAIGCNEQQLKTKITQLEGEKSRLSATLTERESQLAQAHSEAAALAQERDSLKNELAAERARKAPVPGPDYGTEKPVRGGGDGGGRTAAGWMRTSVGDRMTLGGHLLFTPGSATLTAEGRSALSKVAGDLKSHYSGRTVRVYGFTDNAPIVKTKNLWEDNLDLSANRAMAVVRYLWSQGVSKDKLETVAMGDTHPLASNGTADGKKKNRRVEIFVIRGR